MNFRQNSFSLAIPILTILLLLPLSLGKGSTVYLYSVIVFGVLYFFALSLRNVSSSLITFLFFFPMLPLAWSLNFGAQIPLLSVRRIFYLIIIVFYLMRKQKFSKNILPFNISSFLIPLAVAYGFSTLFAFDFKLSLFQLSHFIFEQVLLMIMIYSVLDSVEKAKNGFTALCMSAAVLSIFGLIEFGSGHNYFSDLIFANDKSIDFWNTYQDQIRLGFFGRITSLTTHPMILGGSLAIFVPIIISLILTSKSLNLKIMYSIILATSCMTIFLTVSRSPILALIAGCTFFVLYLMAKAKIKFSLKITLSILVIFYIVLHSYKGLNVLLYSSMTFWKNVEGVSNTGSTWEGRLDMFSNIMSYLASNPFFGVGLGNGVLLINKLKIEMVGVLENFWLQRLLETGLIGLVALLLFSYSTFKIAITQINKILENENMILAVGGISSLVSFFIFATATGDMTLFDLLFIIFPLTIRVTGFSH